MPEGMESIIRIAGGDGKPDQAVKGALEPDRDHPVVSTISKFERARPLFLRLGAEMYEMASDANVRDLYAEAGTMLTLPFPTLLTRYPEARRELSGASSRDTILGITLGLPSGLGIPTLINPSARESGGPGLL